MQRLINVPFDDADADLTEFATKRTEGLAPGPYVLGTPKAKIKVDEDVVVIGHGNGTDLYSHENPNAKNLKKYDASSLADYLDQHVLPTGYAGKITIWGCDTARPYRHIAALAEQIEAMDESTKAAVLDLTFISQLETALEAKKKGYKPTIVGSIGYATLDRDWQIAKVFADAKDQMFGQTAKFAEGFIGTGGSAPSGFYGKSDDSEDSEYESSDSMSDTAPALKSGKYRFVNGITLADRSGISVNSMATFGGNTEVKVTTRTVSEGGAQWQQVELLTATDGNLWQWKGTELWMKSAWLDRGQPF